MNHPRIFGFFTYGGGKWRHAKEYPPPTFGRIVEPFAGSAGYSGKYYWLPVSLYDTSEYIFGVWNYLLRVKSAEVLRLPLKFDTVDDLKICQEAKWLIGYWLQHAENTPATKQGSWMREGRWRVQFWGAEKRERIARQVNLIRHWKIQRLSYEKVRIKRPSDWFVDPPYFRAYRYGQPELNYKHLASWLHTTPKGQIICCENVNASWLKFKPLYDVKALANNQHQEGIWFHKTR